ncbi:secretion protein HlyD [Bryobacterales bacterium F-183]|nr:secretion protein HlyD [Bryobacterales bacterium F-183]
MGFRPAILVVFLAMLFTTACGHGAAGDEEAARPSGSSKNGNTVTVATSVAARRDLSKSLTVTGELIPFQEVEVMSKVAGYVERIVVDVGDSLKQGQLIATLEVPEMKDDVTRAAASYQRFRAEVARSRQEVQRAKAQQRMTKLTYDRLADVQKAQPGLVAQQEVDDAQGRNQIAEAQVAAAESALAVAEEQIKVTEAERTKAETLMRYTRVTAPFDGVVTKRYANNGAMIQSGVGSQTQAMPLVRLSQHSRLRLILPVPESAAGMIERGSTVEVLVPSLNRTFKGTVTRTTNQVDTATRTMHTELDIPNPNGQLIPGMYAEVSLVLAGSANTLAVPLNAIVGTDAKKAVLVVNSQGVVENRPVTTGLETADFVEVRRGVSEGEQVVVGGRSQLRAGQKVQTKVTP